jgi:hypothetical protein
MRDLPTGPGLFQRDMPVMMNERALLLQSGAANAERNSL